VYVGILKEAEAGAKAAELSCVLQGYAPGEAGQVNKLRRLGKSSLQRLAPISHCDHPKEALHKSVESGTKEISGWRG
jgi:hypothetical protein